MIRWLNPRNAYLMLKRRDPLQPPGYCLKCLHKLSFSSLGVCYEFGSCVAKSSQSTTNIGVSVKNLFSKRHYQNKPFLELGTDKNPFYIKKDVTLFYNANTKFYRHLNLLGLSQFIFWTYLSHLSYTTMKNTPVTEKELQDAADSFKTEKPYFISLWRQVNLGQYKDGLSIMGGVIGILALFVPPLYTRNCVKSLILRKGGERITLEYFSVFGIGKLRTVPLAHISAKNSRQNASSYVLLKMKGQKLHTLLDMKGNFPNKELFDRTVGLQRTWAK